MERIEKLSRLTGTLLLLLWVKPALLVELYHEEGGGKWEIQGPATRYLCKQGQESVKLGPGTLPTSVKYIQVEDCGKLELESRLFNHIDNLVNITIRNVDSVVIYNDLFDAKGSAGKQYTLSSIEIHNIRDLQVRRYAFRGTRITNRFYLGEVNMAAVVPMSFAFDYVKEFSVFASKFDRISMWGIKLDRCGEFNILGMTHFSSLAAHAIKARCDKFSMAYNWFGNIHDSSFEVDYVLCDIQGNTFVSLGGMPFIDLRPFEKDDEEKENEISMSGFVFRENKFASDPVLPFGSLAMPSFDKISRESSYVDIDNNMFPCECDAVGWLLAYGQHGYNRESIGDISKIKGTGTLDFLRQVYQTSGRCLKCSMNDCRPGSERLMDYAANSLVMNNEVLSCSSGVVIKNRDVTSPEPDLIILPKSWTDSKEKTKTTSEEKPVSVIDQSSGSGSRSSSSSSSDHSDVRSVPQPDEYNSKPNHGEVTPTNRGSPAQSTNYAAALVACVLGLAVSLARI